MLISVDTGAATPPYEQLREQITRMIHAGVLPLGERLPSIRQLASDLGVAPGTVGRAYTELERDGLIRTRRGRHGSFVAPPTADRRPDPRAELAIAAHQYATHAAHLGVAATDAVQLVRSALNELTSTPVSKEPA